MKVVSNGDVKIKIVAKPKKEKHILESVDKNADKKKIRKGILDRAETCVDHLCGCT